ncbi:TPA: hypothetical protein ACS2XB_003138 [Legionella pneumophila]
MVATKHQYLLLIKIFSWVLTQPTRWIAAGAIIIGGVMVGDNSVVASGSVVTRNASPNTLVGGNPA